MRTRNGAHGFAYAPTLLAESRKLSNVFHKTGIRAIAFPSRRTNPRLRRRSLENRARHFREFLLEGIFFI